MKPTPRNRTPSVKAATAIPTPIPTTRSRDTTAMAAAATPTPIPMTRMPSGQAEPKQQRVFLRLRGFTDTPDSQLASPPITPPAADDSFETASKLHINTTGPPQWMLRMRHLQQHTLPELLTPLTVPAKTYTEVSRRDSCG